MPRSSRARAGDSGGAKSSRGSQDRADDRADGAEAARRADEDLGRGPAWVVVRLGETLFGLPIQRVREVLHPPPVTLVPHAPPAIRGVVSVRGDVVAVLDLGQRLVRRPAAADGRLVVVSHMPTEEPVGLLVDQVTGLLSGGAQAVDDPPREVTASMPEGVVRGVLAGPDERPVATLDLDRVLEIEGADVKESA